MTDVSVRQARHEDLSRIIELLQRGALVEGKEDAADLAPYETALHDIEQQPGGLLVAETEGEVVGVCQLIVFRHLQNHGGLCAEIESVHVHPHWRSYGIGSVLMRQAINRAKELGCYRIQLTSNNDRPDAHRFYVALGFEPSHTGFKLLLSR